MRLKQEAQYLQKRLMQQQSATILEMIKMF